MTDVDKAFLDKLEGLLMAEGDSIQLVDFDGKMAPYSPYLSDDNLAFIDDDDSESPEEGKERMADIFGETVELPKTRIPQKPPKRFAPDGVEVVFSKPKFKPMAPKSQKLKRTKSAVEPNANNNHESIDLLSPEGQVEISHYKNEEKIADRKSTKDRSRNRSMKNHEVVDLISPVDDVKISHYNIEEKIANEKKLKITKERSRKKSKEKSRKQRKSELEDEKITIEGKNDEGSTAIFDHDSTEIPAIKLSPKPTLSRKQPTQKSPRNRPEKKMTTNNLKGSRMNVSDWLEESKEFKESRIQTECLNSSEDDKPGPSRRLRRQKRRRALLESSDDSQQSVIISSVKKDDSKLNQSPEIISEDSDDDILKGFETPPKSKPNITKSKLSAFLNETECFSFDDPPKGSGWYDRGNQSVFPGNPFVIGKRSRPYLNSQPRKTKLLDSPLPQSRPPKSTPFNRNRGVNNEHSRKVSLGGSITPKQRSHADQQAHHERYALSDSDSDTGSQKNRGRNRRRRIDNKRKDKAASPRESETNILISD